MAWSGPGEGRGGTWLLYALRVRMGDLTRGGQWRNQSTDSDVRKGHHASRMWTAAVHLSLIFTIIYPQLTTLFVMSAVDDRWSFHSLFLPRGVQAILDQFAQPRYSMSGGKGADAHVSAGTRVMQAGYWLWFIHVIHLDTPADSYRPKVGYRSFHPLWKLENCFVIYQNSTWFKRNAIQLRVFLLTSPR
jgi:hypothetical protein